ncbi:MAG: YqiA/YcfP family alpha/beta fold hydrolase [Candidatus Thermoplasmatota archaeon]
MLYYIHGYQSSTSSTKAVLFAQTLKVYAIKYREGNPEDLVISACLRRIAQTIQSDPQPVLIGSSFGGFLAAATALIHPVQQLILLNPAIIPPTTSPDSIPAMPKRILNEMIEPRLFQQKVPTKIDILIGTQDTVVPNHWSLEFAKIQEATVHFFHDDHNFTRYQVQLPEIIKKIINRETKRLS